MTYMRFAATLTLSLLAMFAMTYLNLYALEHAFFSQTRAWMALIMISGMALIMMGLMFHMYRNKSVNWMIITASVAAAALALYLVRSQATVDDISYMKAMIPHHSIAVLTSERARIRDPRVRALADGIIETQLREISQMKQLIEELERDPVATEAPRLFPKSRLISNRAVGD